MGDSKYFNRVKKQQTDSSIFVVLSFVSYDKMKLFTLAVLLFLQADGLLGEETAYTLIATKAHCNHAMGGMPSFCHTTGTTPDQLKSHCTNLPSCIGYEIDGSYEYVSSYDYYLFMSDKFCPAGYTYYNTTMNDEPLKQLKTMNDLVPGAVDEYKTENTKCYRKNITQCGTVTVLHTKHYNQGDNGKYLFFDTNDFTNMVGETDWHGKNYEVIQRGSKSWTGMIIVWDGTGQRYDSHGRRSNGSAAGNWAQGDTIQLKACVEAECEEDAQCPVRKPFCDVDNNICKDTCQTDSQCPDNFPFCDTLDGKCKECSDDSHCHGTFSACDNKAHKCVDPSKRCRGSPQTDCNCCSDASPCLEGQGHCKEDSHCVGNLRCGADNCYGEYSTSISIWHAQADCCTSA